MFWGLRTCATWTPVSVGNLQAVKVAQQPAVAGPRPEEDCLLVPLELWIGSAPLSAPSLLFQGLELVVEDGLGLSVGHGVAELFHFAACLG